MVYLLAMQRKDWERFLSTQADHFTGVTWEEKRRPAPFEMTVGAWRREVVVRVGYVVWGMGL